MENPKTTVKERADAFESLRSAIWAGRDDDRVWETIHETTAHRVKLAESERKRLVDLQQMLTAERATLLIARLAEIVTTHVSDRSALSAISIEFAAILDAGAIAAQAS